MLVLPDRHSDLLVPCNDENQYLALRTDLQYIGGGDIDIV
ncbi:hypothetical protein OKW43_008174 [Paraburkholderia sp. WC7.3g]